MGVGVRIHEFRRIRTCTPRQKLRGRLPRDPDALLGDHVRHAPLDLQEDGRIGMIVVKTQPQLEAILEAVNRLTVERESRRVEVQAPNRVSRILPRPRVFVGFQIRADIPANGRGRGLAHHVLQFAPVSLRMMLVSHAKPFGPWTLRRGAACTTGVLGCFRAVGPPLGVSNGHDDRPVIITKP